jgi:thymidylate synthase ThyX
MINYEAKVVEHSAAEHGAQMTTVQLRYPRYIHAELMTHRVFSRNASSSRAIPVAKMADRALAEMVEPIRYGRNQAGMQASDATLTGYELERARSIWQHMAEVCAAGVKELGELGLHKQWANRPLEWFSTISVVLTSTDFSNWDELRMHPDAQPEIQHLANILFEARNASTPILRPRNRLHESGWHLPYVTAAERAAHAENPIYLARLSTARCARTSYLNHDGSNPDQEKDIGLFMDLVGARPLHASPTEHQGYPLPLATQRSKNLVGWRQFRELVEHDIYHPQQQGEKA